MTLTDPGMILQAKPPRPTGRGMITQTKSLRPRKRHPPPHPVDQAAIARQVYNDSPWYQRPFIAAGAEMNRIGRGLQQLITDKDSAKGRALQQRIDADAPMQEGVNGVSGFIGRVLPYAATAVMVAPRLPYLGGWGKRARWHGLPPKPVLRRRKGRAMAHWEKPAQVKTGWPMQAMARWAGLQRGGTRRCQRCYEWFSTSWRSAPAS